MLDELEDINSLLREIEKLKQRSILLEEILRYYNTETMTFDIPKKWKNTHRIRPDKLPAETPRHWMHEKIKKGLSPEELTMLGIYDRCY